MCTAWSAGTADFTFLGLCQIWHLLAVLQAPHLLFKGITSWVSVPFAANNVALREIVETGASLFSSTICWNYEARCAKAVQTSCLQAS